MQVWRRLASKGLGAILVAGSWGWAPLAPAQPALNNGACWQRLALAQVPRRDAAGQRLGGFSALLLEPRGPGQGQGQPPELELLLLSDAPKGRLARARWRAGDSPPQLEETLALSGSPGMALPEAIDGEAMVRVGPTLWVASEGRRTPAQPALVLRFGAASGQLERMLPLPADWQAAPGRGLAANGGPEALTLLRRPGQADALLLAAEHPLLQDPPRQVRLLAWPLNSDPPVARPLAPLLLPWGDWGLTDLLVVADGRGQPQLLALLRRFQPPDRWGARLALYPLPPELTAEAAADPRTRPLAPLASWDLLATPPALPADNWEGLAAGPTLANGRPTVVVVSDDNFSPFQDNHLALLAPGRPNTCAPAP